VPYLLRHWHSAARLNLPVAWLERDGVRLSEPEIERLNLWIEALGAWRVSAMPWPEALNCLDDFLSGNLGRIPSGKGGAGRWTTRAKLEVFFRDGGQRGQTETLFDIAPFVDQEPGKVVGG
jgi:hypothetical protein